MKAVVEWWTPKYVFRYQIQRCNKKPCRIKGGLIHKCGNVLLFDERGSYMDERTPAEFKRDYKPMIAPRSR